MAEESIYNLIPKEYVPPPKQPLYKSKYSHRIPPTASTFGHHTTSVPGISNVSGHTDPILEVHPRGSAGGTFGRPKGAVKPDPQTFSKKGTGKVSSTYNYSGSSSLSPSKKEKTIRFPPIPKHDEKPIHGLKTKKNFVVSNAVEAMLSQPKIDEKPIDFTKKTEYGKVPKYLNEIKEQMHREYEHIKAIHEQEEKEQEKDKVRFVLSEEEIQILREGLKAKWEAVNKEYQKITHISKLDTIGLKRRKEGCEKELAQLEKDLEKLNKAFVVIDSTQ